MGLITTLFFVTTLVAVLYSAPLDQQSESTAVGIRPLPATLTKVDGTQGSIANNGQVQPDSQSNTRPVRDTPQEHISSVPTSSPTDSSSSTPKTDSRQVREVDQQKAPPQPASASQLEDPAHRPPPPPPPGAHPPPPPPPGAHPPPPPADHPGYPSGRPVSQIRTARDTQSTVKPATLPAHLGTQPGSSGSSSSGLGSRRARDISSPLAAAASTTESSVYSTESSGSSSSTNRAVRDLSSSLSETASSTTEKTSSNPGSLGNSTPLTKSAY